MIGQGMHGFVGNDGVEFDDLDHELLSPHRPACICHCPGFGEGV